MYLFTCTWVLSVFVIQFLRYSSRRRCDNDDGKTCTELDSLFIPVYVCMQSTFPPFTERDFHPNTASVGSGARKGNENGNVHKFL